MLSEKLNELDETKPGKKTYTFRQLSAILKTMEDINQNQIGVLKRQLEHTKDRYGEGYFDGFRAGYRTLLERLVSKP